MASVNNIISKFKQAFFDTGSLPSMTVGTEETRSTHEGRGFFVTSVMTSLNAGGTHVLAFTTPASSGSAVHLNTRIQVKGDTLFQIYESASVVQGSGITSTIYNRNRNSPTLSQLKNTAATPTSGSIQSSDTTLGFISVSSFGTKLYEETIGLVGTNADIGEFILAANTTYVMQLISQAAGNRVGINLFIHQH